jgi:SAM-dependent methyltransferase
MTAGLSELIELGGSTAAVAAAHESGLLDSLSEPASPAQHARRLGIDPEAVALVLDTLIALGVAQQRDGRVGNSETLTATRGTPLHDLLPMRDLWRHLPRFLRTGERYAQMDGPPTRRAADYKDLAGALGDLFVDAARELARKLAPAGERILDIGAGSGVWSLEMCLRSPASRVTALDFPEVLPAFMQRAARLGLADRVRPWAGDVHASDLPVATFDRIVIANVLHLERPSLARCLMIRAAGALAHGGELVLVDCLADGDPAKQIAGRVYALHLAMRTSAGRIHPRAQIERWAYDAGLTAGQFVGLDARPWSVAALVHRKPPQSRTQSARRKQ